MGIKPRFWAAAFRQWRFKTLALCLLPWLLVLAVSEWRAVWDEQIAGDPQFHFLDMEELPWYRKPGKVWQYVLDRSGLEYNTAENKWQVIEFARFGDYKTSKRSRPHEIWPVAREIVRELNTVSTRLSQKPDKYHFEHLSASAFPPPSPGGDWTLPEFLRLPKTTAPDLNQTKRISNLVASGRARDSNNAFYDVAQAGYQLMTGDEEAGLRSLTRAAKCTRYETYFYDALAVGITRQGKEQNLSIENETNLWHQYASSGNLRGLAEHSAFIAACEKRQGQHRKALQLIQDVSRIGILVARSRTDFQERNEGRDLQLTLWRYIGGWEDKVAFHKHLWSLGLGRQREADLRVAAQAAASYAKKQGRTDLAREILNQAKQTSALNLTVDRDEPSDFYYRCLLWQWRTQFFLMGQVLMAVAALPLARLLRWNAPEIKFGTTEILLPVVLLLVCGAILQGLTELVDQGKISWIQRYERDWLAWYACLGPVALLIGWWVANGMWRCRETLIPIPKSHMNSGEHWLVWQVIGMALRLSPLIASVTLVGVYWIVRYGKFGTGTLVRTFHSWTDWSLPDLLVWPATGAVVLVVFYSLVFLAKWRWSRSPLVRAEVERSLWGLSRCFVLMALLSSWGYVAVNLAFTPTRLSLAQALRGIERNGYYGNQEMDIWYR